MPKLCNWLIIRLLYPRLGPFQSSHRNNAFRSRVSELQVVFEWPHECRHSKRKYLFFLSKLITFSLVKPLLTRN